MFRRLWLACALAAFVPTLRAADDPTPPPDSPAAQVKALLDEYDKAQTEFFRQYREAKTDEERQKLIGQQPNPDAFAERALALAEKFADDPAAADALTWVAVNARDVAKQAQALKTIVARHVTSDRLNMVCQRMVYSQSSEAEDFLRAVLEKNPHHNVQGLACLSLAQHLKQRGELLQSLAAQPELAERLVQFYGEAYAQRIRATDPTRLKTEVEQLLERVTKDFADVNAGRGTLGAVADRELFEIRHLSIGCVAPEIEGEDIDGAKFKLSDYRGKVVVLDFWGNW